MLSAAESNLIMEQMKSAAQCGFAVNISIARHMMNIIADDHRPGVANNFPSEDTIRWWRAHSRDIKRGEAGLNHLSKLLAESHGHIKTYADRLKAVEELDPGLYENAKYVWNVEDTSVGPKF